MCQRVGVIPCVQSLTMVESSTIILNLSAFSLACHTQLCTEKVKQDSCCVFQFVEVRGQKNMWKEWWGELLSESIPGLLLVGFRMFFFYFMYYFENCWTSMYGIFGIRTFFFLFFFFVSPSWFPPVSFPSFFSSEIIFFIILPPSPFPTSPSHSV